MFLSYTSPLLDQQVLGYDVNWCFIFAAAYCAYYAVIELPGVVGPLAAVMAAGSFVTVNMVKDTYQDQDPWKVGLAVHVVCWVAQFYGNKHAACFMLDVTLNARYEANGAACRSNRPRRA